MEGILNVREKITVGNITYPGAVGDGYADDTEAIQTRLDLLFRFSATATPCAETGDGAWPDYASALYFPAGFYRITRRLRVPYLVNVRLFGEAAGAMVSDPPVPSGAFIRQDTPDEPILVFGDVDVAGNFYGSGWSIDGLGFTWKDQQQAPAGWTYRLADDPLAPDYTDPGAVAILFTGPRVTDPDGATTFYNGDHYHGRITRCRFERGWRGVSIDDTDRAEHPIAVWDVAVENCQFSSFRGAAISYVNGPGQVIGMPNNRIVGTFVENYGAFTDPTHKNVEEQIRLSAQGPMRMANVDLEGSKTAVLYADSSILAIDGLHIENVRIETPYPRMIYLCCGRYTIRGMDVDGIMKGYDPLFPDYEGLSAIVTAQGDAEVTLTAVVVQPHDPEIEDPEEGGFIPLVGPAYLLQAWADPAGRTPTFHLTDRPRMPVYSKGDRIDWPGTAQYGAYRSLSAYADVFALPTTPLVRAPDVKVTETVMLPTIGAGAVAAVAVPVPGARPGDLVRMGLPASFPDRLTVTPVADTDMVILRLANVIGPKLIGGPVTLTLTAGGGPLSGGPQPI